MQYYLQNVSVTVFVVNVLFIVRYIGAAKIAHHRLTKTALFSRGYKNVIEY